MNNIQMNDTSSQSTSSTPCPTPYLTPCPTTFPPPKFRPKTSDAAIFGHVIRHGLQRYTVVQKTMSSECERVLVLPWIEAVECKGRWMGVGLGVTVRALFRQRAEQGVKEQALWGPQG